jgi:glycosidase
MTEKPIIYQLLPRLFANYNSRCVPDGTIDQNGAGKMNGITSGVLGCINDLGVTHVWYTGVIEHAHDVDYTAYGIERDNPHVVKGRAGSPYAISDYYDIDPDIAEDVARRMEEFEALVRRTHDAGMKVIIDFVPNHVARRYHSDAKPAGIEDFGSSDYPGMFFSPGNDFYYLPRQKFAPSFSLGEGEEAYVEFPAKASGNDCFTAFPSRNDWYETVKLNYGVDYGDGSRHFSPIPQVWLKMLHILRYWASKGVDGFRCDMAFMVPVEFWEWAIPAVKERYPDIIFIAEIYDVNLYREFIDRAGFDYLYDKVNLYDTLRAIECCNVSAAQLTSCWQRVDGLGSKLLNFLENHDEQRFASEQYAGDAMRVIPSLIVSAMLSTGPMMIYAGQELGEKGADAEGFSGRDGRTTIFDFWSIPTLRRWLDEGRCSLDKLEPWERALRSLYGRVLTLCNSEKALREGGFFDLMYVNYQNPTLDPHRQYTFMRAADGEALLVAVNFAGHDCDLQINIPRHAFEVLGLQEGEADAQELLSGKDPERRNLDSSTPFATHVSAHGAVVWKFTAPKPADNKTETKAPCRTRKKKYSKQTKTN